MYALVCPQIRHHVEPVDALNRNTEVAHQWLHYNAPYLLKIGGSSIYLKHSHKAELGRGKVWKRKKNNSYQGQVRFATG